jgi:hypothetical protein
VATRAKNWSNATILAMTALLSPRVQASLRFCGPFCSSAMGFGRIASKSANPRIAGRIVSIPWSPFQRYPRSPDFVIAKLELGDIERQIFSTHFVERSDYTALENRPETFDGLGMNCSDDVLAPGMVYRCGEPSHWYKAILLPRRRWIKQMTRLRTLRKEEAFKPNADHKFYERPNDNDNPMARPRARWWAMSASQKRRKKGVRIFIAISDNRFP